MPFADTWDEEAGKYGIVNDNAIVMPILREYTKRFLDKNELKRHGDTPAKRYELSVEQLKARINYKSFHNDMMKAMEKKKQMAKKDVNKVKAQLLKKLIDPALKNALSSYLRGNFGIQSVYNRTIEDAYVKSLKKYIREYDDLDKRKPDAVSAMVHKYKDNLKKFGVYWNHRMPYFENDMSFPQQKGALKSLYVHYNNLIKKIKR